MTRHDVLPVWLVADKQLTWRWKIMYRTDCGTAHPVLLNQLSKVNKVAAWPCRSSFISGELNAAGIAYIYIWLESSYDPQNATLDSLRTLSGFVSYRGLSPQFQFFLSAVTLVYLYRWKVHQRVRTREPMHWENGKLVHASRVYASVQSVLLGGTAARSRHDSRASPAKKIRLLEKKLGRKQATPAPPPPNHLKNCSKNLCMQIIGPIFANYC